MPVPLVLNILCEEARRVQTVPPIQWKPSKPTATELAFLKQECETPSPFDPLKLRFNTWGFYKSGKYKMKCSECELARVISILPAHVEPPLEDWGKLFQWVGAPTSSNASPKQWTIYWLGATTKREFPERGIPLGPSHVNGGYTIPCSSIGIFIYRIEEATRVLVHELLHAACLDPKDASLPVREATIETWGELFLVAHRAKGDLPEAERLWNLQAQWITDTNNKATTDNKVLGEANYAWRYLNGRAHILQSLGVELPAPRLIHGKASLRFTHPALD